MLELVKVINLRCACAARVTVLGLLVFLSVSLFPRFLPPRATRKQNSDTKRFSATYTGLILNLANIVKLLRSRGENLVIKANMQISTGLPRPDPLALCILEAPEIAMRGVYQLSHAGVTRP